MYKQGEVWENIQSYGVGSMVFLVQKIASLQRNR